MLGCLTVLEDLAYNTAYVSCLEAASLGKRVHRAARQGWCLKCDWQTLILREQLLHWSLMSYLHNPLPLHFTIWVLFNGWALSLGAAEICKNSACLHTCMCFYPFCFQEKSKA